MKGFTLVELLVTISVLAALAIIVGVNIYGFYGRRNLALSGDEIIAALTEARSGSLTQENSNQWGVRFFNATTTPAYYRLFYGSSFSAGTTTLTQYLPAGIQFVSPGSGSSTDVIFSKITGYPAASTSVIVALKINQNVSSTINISSIGVISKL